MRRAAGNPALRVFRFVSDDVPCLTCGMVRRLAIVVGVWIVLAPAAAFGAAEVLFKPDALPAGQVGVRYQVVIRVSIGGHHPALGKDYPSYTVACFGADPQGGYMDDCPKLPPGLALGAYQGPGCSPPLRYPDCVVLRGKPRKAGRYTFRISAPDVNSAGVRGILRRYTVVIKP